MPHICALCGQISFKTMHEYEAHRRLCHGIKAPIRPEKVSGRSPSQIVADAEATWLKPHLIVNEGPLEITAGTSEHLDSCRCNPCFQKKLDALVDSTERSAQEAIEAEAKRGTV